ncbi:MAG: anaerobic sulfatase maturase [Planctomycetota bacterium]
MRDHRKPLHSVLVKPAGPDCNLACAYCFYLDRARLFGGAALHRMDARVLEATIQQTLSAGAAQVSFGWQGGEPTLMGVPFFQRAVELEQRHGRSGQTVGNGLQTNGLLIDAAWCRFLRDQRFLVGLSLDGPQHVHDRYRLARGGQPTWARVRDAAKRLLDGGVEVNALAVVNDHSAAYPLEIYAFLRDSGLRHMQFIPCLEREPGAAGPTAFSVRPEPLGRFLCAVFDAWRADFRAGRPTTFVRWFDSVFATYVGVRAPECTLLPECGRYVVVEHNGDVFACDFYVVPEWRLGNVCTGRLVEMLNAQRQARFGRRKAALAATCQACRWLAQCRGGCPRDRWDTPNSGRENVLCEAYRMFFAHADAEFRRLAAAWQPAYTSRGAAQAVAVAAGLQRRGAERNAPCPCGSGVKYKHCCGR